MRTLLAAVALVLVTSVPVSAITLNQAKTQAAAWVTARQDTILDRIMTCVTENPRLCHTAWVSSTTPNTAPADGALATVTFDDPGRLDPCGLPTNLGTYSAAGIAIPASGPVNVKINIAKSRAGWGAQVVIRIQYDGQIYERGFGRGIFAGFAWRLVLEGL